MNDDTSVRPITWRQALKRLETGERNAVKTKSVVAAGKKDDQILHTMDRCVLTLRNFGRVAAYELAFALWQFLDSHDALERVEAVIDKKEEDD
jgi:hypothetical protein